MYDVIPHQFYSIQISHLMDQTIEKHKLFEQRFNLSGPFQHETRSWTKYIKYLSQEQVQHELDL